MRCILRIKKVASDNDDEFGWSKMIPPPSWSIADIKGVYGNSPDFFSDNQFAYARGKLRDELKYGSGGTGPVLRLDGKDYFKAELSRVSATCPQSKMIMSEIHRILFIQYSQPRNYNFYTASDGSLYINQKSPFINQIKNSIEAIAHKNNCEVRIAPRSTTICLEGNERPKAASNFISDDLDSKFQDSKTYASYQSDYLFNTKNKNFNEKVIIEFFSNLCINTIKNLGNISIAIDSNLTLFYPKKFANLVEPVVAKFEEQLASYLTMFNNNINQALTSKIGQAIFGTENAKIEKIKQEYYSFEVDKFVKENNTLLKYLNLTDDQIKKIAKSIADRDSSEKSFVDLSPQQKIEKIKEILYDENIYAGYFRTQIFDLFKNVVIQDVSDVSGYVKFRDCAIQVAENYNIRSKDLKFGKLEDYIKIQEDGSDSEYEFMISNFKDALFVNVVVAATSYEILRRHVLEHSDINDLEVVRLLQSILLYLYTNLVLDRSKNSLIIDNLVNKDKNVYFNKLLNFFNDDNLKRYMLLDSFNMDECIAFFKNFESCFDEEYYGSTVFMGLVDIANTMLEKAMSEESEMAPDL